MIICTLKFEKIYAHTKFYITGLHIQSRERWHEREKTILGALYVMVLSTMIFHIFLGVIFMCILKLCNSLVHSYGLKIAF